MEERIIKKLMTTVKCTSCGHSYSETNVRILGHHHKLWFIRVYCPSCHTQYLLAAEVSSEDAKIVTDLTQTEIRQFKNARALTADDILDMHDFLQKFDGNFAQLFGRERVS